jgi:trans-aconitate 2-methyltransferase
VTDRYTYGDSDAAARRLEVVAEMFEPTSRNFLVRWAPRSPSLTVDLGCGPGITTRLVHEITGSARTVGLDRSEAFLGRARPEAPPGVSFVEHDAREVPFPTGAVDLAYARLLLAHLKDPASVVRGWASQLRPGGLLLLDEPESVDTDEPLFINYLDHVARAVIRAQGAELFVGPQLHAMSDPIGTARLADEVVSFAPPLATTASVFAMNLGVLTDRGEVEPMPELAEGLEAVVNGEPAAAATWRARHVVFRRA